MPNVPGNPQPTRPDLPDLWVDLAIASMIESGRLHDPDTILVVPGGWVETEKRRKGGIDKALQEEYRTQNESITEAPELREAEPFTTDQGRLGYRR